MTDVKTESGADCVVLSSCSTFVLFISQTKERESVYVTVGDGTFLLGLHLLFRLMPSP